MIPVFDVFVRLFHEFEFLFRVVNECAKFFFLAFSYLASEQFVDFSLDVSRCVFQDMSERLVFAVKVGEEVLGAFRQVEYGLKVNYLGACCSYRGKRLRE